MELEYIHDSLCETEFRKRSCDSLVRALPRQSPSGLRKCVCGWMWPWASDLAQWSVDQSSSQMRIWAPITHLFPFVPSTMLPDDVLSSTTIFSAIAPSLAFPPAKLPPPVLPPAASSPAAVGNQSTQRYKQTDSKHRRYRLCEEFYQIKEW